MKFSLLLALDFNPEQVKITTHQYYHIIDPKDSKNKVSSAK